VIRTIRTELSGRASRTLRQGGPNSHSLLQNCDDRSNSEFHFLSCREVKQRYQGLRGCGEDRTLALIECGLRRARSRKAQENQSLNRSICDHRELQAAQQKSSLPLISVCHFRPLRKIAATPCGKMRLLSTDEMRNLVCKGLRSFAR
jgi:hypothetical protein